MWTSKPQKGGKMPFARTFDDHQTAALGLSIHPLCNTVPKTACFRYGSRYFTLAVREKTVFRDGGRSGLPPTAEKREITRRFVAKAAQGWTFDAGIRRKRRRGCRRLDLWRRKRPETSPGVPADGPLAPESAGSRLGRGSLCQARHRGMTTKLHCGMVDTRRE